jgi:hypothetical protein
VAETSIVVPFNDWIVKFCNDGKIIFNKEEHPEWTADDFAKEFIRIIENDYGVVIKKKEPKPYPGFEDLWREE